MSVVPPHLPPMPVPVLFSGNRGEFFRLVTRGAGLELITVGFYRFWLATDIRRHLWTNTPIHCDAAEYTGRGKELLIGFLIALAIIVPVYLAYFLAGLEAERIKAFASFPLLAFLYVFGQFAIYRARRYRLTRTVRLGLAVCGTRRALGSVDAGNRRRDLAVAGSGARALQDAAFLFRRPARQLLWARLGVV